MSVHIWTILFSTILKMEKKKFTTIILILNLTSLTISRRRFWRTNKITLFDFPPVTVTYPSREPFPVFVFNRSEQLKIIIYCHQRPLEFVSVCNFVLNSKTFAGESIVYGLLVLSGFFFVFFLTNTYDV